MAGAAQVMRIERVREIAGKASVEIAYFVTSLPAGEAKPNASARSRAGPLGDRECAAGAHKEEVRNELTDCVTAVRVMKAGPSESASRSGLQTTPSCCGKEPWW
jgi:hypothetical protein